MVTITCPGNLYLILILRSPDFDNETNEFIMFSVLRFIKYSHRFD